MVVFAFDEQLKWFEILNIGEENEIYEKTN